LIDGVDRLLEPVKFTAPAPDFVMVVDAVTLPLTPNETVAVLLNASVPVDTEPLTVTVCAAL